MDRRERLNREYAARNAMVGHQIDFWIVFMLAMIVIVVLGGM